MLIVSCIYTQSRQKVTRKVKKILRILLKKSGVLSDFTHNERLRCCQLVCITYLPCAKNQGLE